MKMASEAFMNISPLVLLFALFLVASDSSLAQNYGSYLGAVKTEWLDEDGRKMRLLEDFSYVDPTGVVWEAPAESVVDGASIPKVVWSFIGGPFSGKYRNASVVHDVGCVTRTRSWKDTHRMFYWAMRASGVSELKAKIMYAAVYHKGPRWSEKRTIRNLPSNQVPIAERRALRNTAPGSTATVERVVRIGAGELFDPNPISNFIVRVDPPSVTLDDSGFDALKSDIEASFVRASGQMSLEEIENFK